MPPARRSGSEGGGSRRGERSVAVVVPVAVSGPLGPRSDLDRGEQGAPRPGRARGAPRRPSRCRRRRRRGPSSARSPPRRRGRRAAARRPAGVARPRSPGRRRPPARRRPSPWPCAATCRSRRRSAGPAGRGRPGSGRRRAGRSGRPRGTGAGRAEAGSEARIASVRSTTTGAVRRRAWRWRPSPRPPTPGSRRTRRGGPRGPPAPTPGGRGSPSRRADSGLTGQIAAHGRVVVASGRPVPRFWLRGRRSATLLRRGPADQPRPRGARRRRGEPRRVRAGLAGRRVAAGRPPGRRPVRRRRDPGGVPAGHPGAGPVPGRRVGPHLVAGHRPAHLRRRDPTPGRQRRSGPASRPSPTRRVRRSPPPPGEVELAHLVAALDPDRREAFVLTQVLGLPYAEAADVCGVPVGTIRSRVARARGDLLVAVGRRRRGPHRHVRLTASPSAARSQVVAWAPHVPSQPVPLAGGGPVPRVPVLRRPHRAVRRGVARRPPRVRADGGSPRRGDHGVLDRSHVDLGLGPGGAASDPDRGRDRDLLPGAGGGRRRGGYRSVVPRAGRRGRGRRAGERCPRLARQPVPDRRPRRGSIGPDAGRVRRGGHPRARAHRGHVVDHREPGGRRGGGGGRGRRPRTRVAWPDGLEGEPEPSAPPGPARPHRVRTPPAAPCWCRSVWRPPASGSRP